MPVSWPSRAYSHVVKPSLKFRDEIRFNFFPLTRSSRDDTVFVDSSPPPLASLFFVAMFYVLLACSVTLQKIILNFD